MLNMAPDTGTETRNAEPVPVWQSVQWQIAVLSGSASPSMVMKPQWQPPSIRMASPFARRTGFFVVLQKDTSDGRKARHARGRTHREGLMGCERWVVLLGALLLAGAARAQDAVKVIVPFAAGGPVDAMERLLASEMQGAVGVCTVVENCGGGGGAIGTAV